MIAEIFLYVFLSGLVFCVVKFCYKHYRIYQIMKHFPKPDETTFLLGNMNQLATSDVDIFLSLRKFAKDLHPQYALRLFYLMAANILTPEDCEIFLSTKKHSTKSLVYDSLKHWLREGLLISEGRKWLLRRKILTQAFHFNILKDFVSVFNEGTERALDIISRKCTEPIEICELVTEFTLMSICETAMGCKLNLQDEQTREYINAVHEIEQILQYRLMRPWLHTTFPYCLTSTYRNENKYVKILHDFTRGIIRKRMESFEDDINDTVMQNGDHDDVFMGRKKRRLAMLDVLLQAQRDDGVIDYEGICEEVDTFMFEGHDTTGTAISFSMMLIANHPKIQERIVKEMETVLGGKTNRPTYEDLQRMEYLERCIKEALRLYPSVFFISRVAEEDAILKSGLRVPEGALVHIHIFEVLRNPEVFPSPDTFDPDRFSLENCQQRHPFAFIPFSAGPRNCIGQKYALLEIKAFLIGVLSRFELTPIDTPESIVLSANLVLRAKGGIRVKFKPRI